MDIDDSPISTGRPCRPSIELAFCRRRWRMRRASPAIRSAVAAPWRLVVFTRAGARIASLGLLRRFRLGGGDPERECGHILRIHRRRPIRGRSEVYRFRR